MAEKTTLRSKAAKKNPLVVCSDLLLLLVGRYPTTRGQRYKSQDHIADRNPALLAYLKLELATCWPLTVSNTPVQVWTSIGKRPQYYILRFNRFMENYALHSATHIFCHEAANEI